MKQIQMNKSKNLSVEDAYDLFIRKCRVKNLSQASIVSYQNKIQPFVDISSTTVRYTYKASTKNWGSL